MAWSSENSQSNTTIMGIMRILDDFLREKRKKAVSEKWKRELTSSFKNLKTHRRLTKEQKKEIQEFYKSVIGREIDLYSHEYFYSRTGLYSKYYVPTNLHQVELLGRANMLPYTNAYGDKNMTDVFLKGVRQPHTFLKNINGYYYVEGKPVTEEQAVEQCSQLKNMLIKPTLFSRGKGIQALEVTDGITNIDGMTVGELFRQYKKNFQIQERLKQHAQMSMLNPSSVNTIRIITFRSGMEILVISVVVRIGRKGAVIDNQCAGGISAVINEEGRLGKYGFGGFDQDDILTTDTGTVLEGFQIPSFDKVVEKVKELHFQLPFFDLIGWDMAVAEDGEPVLIEWNTRVGLSQSAYGPGFGKYTERILRELWPRKNTRVF